MRARLESDKRVRNLSRYVPGGRPGLPGPDAHEGRLPAYAGSITAVCRGQTLVTMQTGLGRLPALARQAIQALVLVVAVIAFCFLWLFPRISPLMPWGDNTVDNGARSHLDCSHPARRPAVTRILVVDNYVLRLHVVGFQARGDLRRPSARAVGTDEAAD